MAPDSQEPPGEEPDDSPQGDPGASRGKYAGRRMGKFKIRGELGRGGMGVVLEAYDTELDRAVAIKFLPRATAAQGDATERFRREARAAAKLQHPHVVAVYEAGEFLGQRYLVMELVRGGSLQDALRRGRLPWREATQAVADACRGLEVAHRAGFVHRDIKPSNLMRGEDGRVKLADFGLARPLEPDQAGTTASGAVLGTPHYMSPEQCRSELADERSDIYSLGATYYALLTGRSPFPGAAPLLVMNSHVLDPVPDPRAADPRIPAACGALIRRAMDKAPERRHATAAELLGELESILRLPDEAPVEVETRTSEDVTPLVRNAAPRFSWRTPGIWAAALGGLILLAAFADWLGRRGADTDASSDAGAMEADATPFQLQGMTSRLWRADDSRPSWVMSYPGITHVRVAPSGEFLVVLSRNPAAAGKAEPTIRCEVWSRAGKWRFRSDSSFVEDACCDVSSDSRWCAVGAGTDSVRVWDTRLWRRRAPIFLSGELDRRVTDVAFADGANLIVCANSQKSAARSGWEVHRVVDGKYLAGSELAGEAACGVVAGGANWPGHVATGGSEGVLSVWKWGEKDPTANFRTGQAIQVLKASQNGRHLAVGAGNYFALWDVPGARRDFAAPGGGKIVAVEFSRDDRFVDWATADSLRRLEVVTKHEVARSEGFPASIVSFSAVPGSSYVLLATGDGQLVLWWRDQRSESKKSGG